MTKENRFGLPREEKNHKLEFTETEIKRLLKTLVEMLLQQDDLASENLDSMIMLLRKIQKLEIVHFEPLNTTENGK